MAEEANPTIHPVMADTLSQPIVHLDEKTNNEAKIEPLIETEDDGFAIGHSEKFVGNTAALDLEAIGHGLDLAYAQKADLVSQALQAIGMTAWQYKMWAVCGLGWIVDNIAAYGPSVTYTPVANEFVITNVALTGISYNLGAFIGAMFWGPMADIIGRRLAFNCTLFMVGIFLIAAGGSNNIYTYGAMMALVGFGSGGNVPVAATVYLEFVPSSGFYLLTILSAWWAVGAVIDALMAWAFIGNFSCDMSVVDICLKADNMGWRYTLYTLGTLVIVLACIRLFLFRIPESPYFLLARGRDAEAVEVVSYLAMKSKKSHYLTLDQFRSINDVHGRPTNDSTLATSIKDVLVGHFQGLSASRLKVLWGTPKLALHTTLIVWIWASIGVAYPLYTYFLPLYLTAKFKAISYDYSTSNTYKQYCYIAACTVPGPIAAGFAIQTKFGRRYCMAFGTILSGVLLYLSTIAATNGAVVGFNCAATAVINFMFAIQYAYTPESFPSPVRATVNGLCSMIGYVCGIAAPIISSQAGVSTNVPVYTSGALFLVTGVAMFGLPFETNPGA